MRRVAREGTTRRRSNTTKETELYREPITLSNEAAQVLDLSNKLHEKLYREASMWVSRACTYFFPPAAFMLFHVILSHTLPLGRDRLTVSVYALTRGRMCRKQGRMAQVAIPYSTPTIRKALAWLEYEQYVRVQRGKDDRGGHAPNVIILNLPVLRARMAEGTKDRPGLPYILDIEEAPDAPYSEKELLRKIDSAR